jgi:hypothetical protein
MTDGGFNAVDSEKLAGGVAGFADAIGVEEQDSRRWVSGSRESIRIGGGWPALAN